MVSITQSNPETMILESHPFVAAGVDDHATESSCIPLTQILLILTFYHGSVTIAAKVITLAWFKMTAFHYLHFCGRGIQEELSWVVLVQGAIADGGWNLNSRGLTGLHSLFIFSRN